MDPDEGRALQNAHDGGDHGALHPLVGGQVQGLADAGLAGGGQQHGIAHAAQPLQVVDDGQVVLIVLAEAHAGVQDDLLVGDTGLLGDGQAVPHVLAEVLQEVAILRLLPVVHQAAGHLILGDEVGHLSVILQAPDVVDQVCARLQGGLHHLALIAVDGHGGVEVLFDHLDHGDHPVDLLLHADLNMAGAGGLAAHVHDGRALGDHVGGVETGGL